MVATTFTVSPRLFPRLYRKEGAKKEKIGDGGKLTIPRLLGGGRWLKYLPLSLLVNLLIMSVININKQPVLSQEIPMLKVKLMALAANTPEPVQQQVKQPPQAAATKKVVTKPQAQKKVAALKPAVIPQPAVTNSKSVAKKIPQERAVKPIAKKALQKFPVLKPATTLKTDNEKKLQKRTAFKPAVVMLNNDQSRRTSTIIHEANYRKQIPPVYPRRALELGQEGTVTLHAKVTPAGLPRELKVAKSSGHRLLDMAALAAVKKWEFEPTNINGNSITSWVRVPVRFVIHQ